MDNTWNKHWKDDANRAFWTEPDKAVVNLLTRVDRAKINKVLDLGCGIGRHALLFAKAGFSVTAVDSSAEALAVLRQKAQEENVKLKIIQGEYTQANLFPRSYFDFVIAFNVIYHGTRKDMENAINTVHYWLKPEGRFFFTCPTRRDSKYGNGEKAGPNTFRPQNSVHPGDIHYFSDDNDIQDFMRNFKVIEKKTDEHYWDNNGVKQFNSYYQILAAKL